MFAELLLVFSCLGDAAFFICHFFATTVSDGRQFHPLFRRYFTFITECKDPKACTIVLRGASKDILNEMERNLMDAMSVARNVMLNPKLCPGGGATEMVSTDLLVSGLTFPLSSSSMRAVWCRC